VEPSLSSIGFVGTECEFQVLSFCSTFPQKAEPTCPSDRPLAFYGKIEPAVLFHVSLFNQGVENFGEVKTPRSFGKTVNSHLSL
jgi:hypothetical protein